VIDQTAPSAAETLSRLVREHGVRGIQLTSMDMPHGVLWDPRTFPVWERAAEAGTPVTSRPGSRIGYVHGTSAVLERFRPYADTLGNAPSPPRKISGSRRLSQRFCACPQAQAHRTSGPYHKCQQSMPPMMALAVAGCLISTPGTSDATSLRRVRMSLGGLRCLTQRDDVMHHSDLTVPSATDAPSDRLLAGVGCLPGLVQGLPIEHA
jgi:hypothetical protein